MTDEELIERLGRVKELPRLVVELMTAVRKIPHYCGREDCNHFGCRELRNAREKCLEIINARPGPT
jgi:hypothetical protein